jgi:hypothetical protein
MSATDTLEAQIAALLFQNTGAANIGDATGLRGSTVAGSLYIALWVGDPLDTALGGVECAYTGYARQAVVRSGAGFTVTGTTPTTVSNAAALTFPSCTAAPGSPVTHCAFMTASTGGTMLLSGPLGATYQPAVGSTPASFATGALTATID